MAQLLSKIASGLNAYLDRDSVHELNRPNYELEDILIREMTMEIAPFNPLSGCNRVNTRGSCVDFLDAANAGSRFPELRWDHDSAALLNVVIGQAGKVSHNVCSEGRNGVALRSLDMKFRRQATMRDISFLYESEIFQRRDEVWANSRWQFMQSGRKFANFDIVSRGVSRDYSRVAERHSSRASSTHSRSTSYLRPSRFSSVYRARAGLRSSGQ